MVAERRDPSTPWTPARSRDGRRMVSITQIRKARDHRSGVGGAVRGCQEATTHTWSTAECEHGQLVSMRASRLPAQHARLGRWMSGIHWQQKAPKTEGLRGGETTRLPHTHPKAPTRSHTPTETSPGVS